MRHIFYIGKICVKFKHAPNYFTRIGFYQGKIVTCLVLWPPDYYLNMGYPRQAGNLLSEHAVSTISWTWDTLVMNVASMAHIVIEWLHSGFSLATHPRRLHIAQTFAPKVFSLAALDSDNFIFIKPLFQCSPSLNASCPYFLLDTFIAWWLHKSQSFSDSDNFILIDLLCQM